MCKKEMNVKAYLEMDSSLKTLSKQAAQVKLLFDYSPSSFFF